MIRNLDRKEGESGTTFRGEQRKYTDKDFIPGPVKKGFTMNLFSSHCTCVSFMCNRVP